LKVLQYYCLAFRGPRWQGLAAGLTGSKGRECSRVESPLLSLQVSRQTEVTLEHDFALNSNLGHAILSHDLAIETLHGFDGDCLRSGDIHLATFAWPIPSDAWSNYCLPGNTSILAIDLLRRYGCIVSGSRVERIAFCVRHVGDLAVESASAFEPR
jgi:hypothetical protein